ncbi:MAG: 50S ribosomal protein L25 [Planctomycetales bacterium]|nr:50S ribosomal protein L25 [Planctomycetales bacterium]
MSNSDTLNVVIREERGSGQVKKLRASGCVPAILYGHGGENIALSIQASAVNAAIRSGVRAFGLAGGLTDTALLKDVQWDAFGSSILHIDFLRVDPNETVELSVPIELRGTSPGTKEGGIVTQLAHTLPVICSVVAIPEKLSVSIGSLQLGESITAGNVKLPAGVKLGTDESVPVVQCAEKAAEQAPEAEEAHEAEAEGSGDA